MTRTVRAAAGIALALGVTACERPQTPTAPTTEAAFAMGPPAAVVFEAELTQTRLVSVSCDQGVCDLEFEGSAAANILGPATATASVVQDFNITPCNDAIAEITLTGARGSITLADLAGSVCPISSPSGFPQFISSSWEIVAGTGAFSGISGSGTARGPIGGAGPVVHLSGTVSY
jgi:hypothetical protein